MTPADEKPKPYEYVQMPEPSGKTDATAKMLSELPFGTVVLIAATGERWMVGPHGIPMRFHFKLDSAGEYL